MRTLRNNLPHPLAVTIVLSACLLSCSGCGNGENVVSVSGKVTHNDKPVAGMVVSFVPQATTASGVSTGTTDADGKYSLTVFKTGQGGAVVGTHKVWLSLPRKPPGPRDKEKKGALTTETEIPPETAEILEKYGNLAETPLTVEVKSGQPIDLKLD
jgi:hypothetical protein